MQENDYDSAAGYYEEAAEYFEKIADRGNCECPIIEKNAQSNADKYYQQADKCDDLALEHELYKEYQLAVEICTEGHSYARDGNYEDAIDAFEEAAEIWDGIAEETESRYCQNSKIEARKARKAAERASKLLEE